ncbi:MAG: ferritin-like domain-containing protein [Myxococcota bacterium]
MKLSLGELSLERGGTVLVAQALGAAPAGAEIELVGSDPELAGQLAAWCRPRGLRCDGLRVTAAPDPRWTGALASGHPDPTVPGAVAAVADPRWGLAARGAVVEDGAPELSFALSTRDEIWDDDAPRLYAAAVAAQWDPATVPWDAPRSTDPAVEAAVVQVMTYLVENEAAALLVPARFLPTIHPHYREVVAFLATQIADEARHIEVFTRRASMGGAVGRSGRGGQASLATLVREPEWPLASFLLSVMGEASFLELLRFLADVAPDPITATVARLAAQDEARHVAFAVGHLRRACERDPDLRHRLAAAAAGRERALQQTAGLTEATFDALVVLAAGGLDPVRIGAGFDRVVDLGRRMDRARRGHLQRLGFDEARAAELSSLHTRNFM